MTRNVSRTGFVLILMLMAYSPSRADTKVLPTISSPGKSSLESSAAQQARILKGILPHANLAQVRKLFPANTVLTGPVWSFGITTCGNYFTLSGAQKGYVSFINESIKNIGPTQKFSVTDSINQVEILASIGSNQRTVEHRFVLALSRWLGRPAKVWLEQSNNGPPHWNAQWNLSGGRIVRYSPYFDTAYGLVQDGRMGLSMEFAYSILGDE